MFQVSNTVPNNFFKFPNTFFKVHFSDIDSVLDQFLRDEFSYSHEIKPATLLKDQDGNQVLVYNVLGLGKDDVEILFTSRNGKRYLGIKAKKENEYGLKFSLNNMFPVNKMIDEDKVKCKVEDGLAYVTLPLKDEFKANDKYVKIE